MSLPAFLSATCIPAPSLTIATSRGAARFGAPLCTFHRADLLGALASAVDTARVHLDHRVIEITEAGRASNFALPTACMGGLLIVDGADGVHSVVRRMLYGDDNPA